MSRGESSPVPLDYIVRVERLLAVALRAAALDAPAEPDQKVLVIGSNWCNRTSRLLDIPAKDLLEFSKWEWWLNVRRAAQRQECVATATVFPVKLEEPDVGRRFYVAVDVLHATPFEGHLFIRELDTRIHYCDLDPRFHDALRTRHSWISTSSLGDYVPLRQSHVLGKRIESCVHEVDENYGHCSRITLNLVDGYSIELPSIPENGFQLTIPDSDCDIRTSSGPAEWIADNALKTELKGLHITSVRSGSGDLYLGLSSGDWLRYVSSSPSKSGVFECTAEDALGAEPHWNPDTIWGPIV